MNTRCGRGVYPLTARTVPTQTPIGRRTNEAVLDYHLDPFVRRRRRGRLRRLGPGPDDPAGEDGHRQAGGEAREEAPEEDGEEGREEGPDEEGREEAGRQGSQERAREEGRGEEVAPSGNPAGRRVT